MNLHLVVLLSTLLLAGLSPLVHGNSSAPDVIDDSYAKPGESVDIGGGRALNLRCSGEGKPVVLLEAGSNADASTWYRVQPQLALLTRVCAYDRAGYGFSDEGTYPRDLDAYVADLHALIRATQIPTPVILVGHSLGSNIVRKYARQYPDEVAGMVLVDPPEQGSDDPMPQEWKSQDASMLAQRETVLSACARAADAGDADTLKQKCVRPPPPWMSTSVASAMARTKAKPSYWRTLRSELAQNTDVFSTPVPTDESYGSIPLVLLRAPLPDAGMPPEVLRVIEDKRSQTHARILSASTRSSAIDVPDTSHDIQLDRPEAVVSAVRTLLGTVDAADGRHTRE